MGPVTYFSLCLLSCLIFSPSLAGARAPSCPRGWLHFQDNCYGYFPKEATWRRAEAWCQIYVSGAHLASIHSEEEHNAVAGFVARSQHHDDDDGDNVWIGLSTYGRRRRWSWTDDSEVDFDAWDSHRSYSFPSLKAERCLALEEGTGFMTWVSEFCKNRNTFVCKYRP
ncbi:unnamed protein product [Lepidochelys kempii]